jgi:hypothetical protein
MEDVLMGNIPREKLLQLVNRSDVVATVTCAHPERNLPEALITSIYRRPEDAPSWAANHEYLLDLGNDQRVFDGSRPVTLISRVSNYLPYSRWRIECHLCDRAPRYEAATPFTVQINAERLARVALMLTAAGIGSVTLGTLRRACTRSC